MASYVRRDHDEKLRNRLYAAAHEGGGLMLLTGQPCTGKTRSAWGAIRGAHIFSASSDLGQFDVAHGHESGGA